MIIDGETITLTQDEQVDTITEEYALLPAGKSPTSTTTWSEVQPDYIDNPGGTQYEYWTRQKLSGHDDEAQEGFTKYTEPVNDKDLTKSGRTAAMVRQYGAGVLVCRKGKTVGALVNADGSFDVVRVSWSGDVPTAGTALASYGSNLMVMRDADAEEYLRMENLSASAVTISQNVIADSKMLTLSYEITSVTSITKIEDSTTVTSYTINANQISSNSLVNGKKYTVVYTSTDYLLKAYTFGSRKSGTGKGGQSLSVGYNNTASGLSSVAIGYNLIANQNWQFVIGNNNKTDNNMQFIVADSETNLFSVSKYSGAIVMKNPKNGVYSYIGQDTDSNGAYTIWSLYDSAGSRVRRMSLTENNVLVDGIKQFYQTGDTISFTNAVTPFAGYMTDSSATIRITIPVDKSLQFITSLEVTRMKGAIVGVNGYVTYDSANVGSHQCDWLANCDVAVTKVNNHLIQIVLTNPVDPGHSGDSGKFLYTVKSGNTVTWSVYKNNTPMNYCPSYGGLVISCI